MIFIAVENDALWNFAKNMKLTVPFKPFNRLYRLWAFLIKLPLIKMKGFVSLCMLSVYYNYTIK